MELFKLLGTIAIDSSGAENAIESTTKNAETSSNKIVNAFKKVATAVATFLAVDKIKDFGLACVNAAADAQAMNSQFEQVFGSLEDSASESLSAIAKQAGVTETRMKGSFTKIAAFAKTTGMDTADALELSERAMIAVADSAAFYDRSLEETTESLQSFLKGNYENDSALGLSCTETTRNAAAMKLFGDEFKKLSEEQKQLTLLKMVEDANKTSGALGQAARESNTWTNQVGNLKQAWIDFQAKVGEKVLPKVVEAVGWLSNGITELGNYVEPVFQVLQDGFAKVKDVASDMSEFWYEVLQPAFSEVGAALGLVWDAFKPVIQSFADLLPKMDNSKTGMDYFRDACWAVEDALLWVAKKLKEVSDWISKNKPLVETMIVVLGSFAAAWVVVNGAIAAFTTVAGIATTVATGLGAVIGFLTSPIGIAVVAITSLIAIGVALYKNWDVIKAKCAELWQNVTEKFEAIKSSITYAVTNAKNIAVETFQKMKNGAVEKFNSIKTSAANTFNTVKSTISTKLQSAKDNALRIFNDIKSGISTKIGAARDTVKGAIDKIKGFFNFQWSLPSLKMPHPYISGSFSLDPPSVPSFGIDWYKKAMNDPIIMNSPTAFGINKLGQVMAGGEAGSEVVSGTDTLMNMISEAVASKNARLEAVLANILAYMMEYMPQMANMQLVTDTGALIGELAPGMDEALGILARREERGI